MRSAAAAAALLAVALAAGCGGGGKNETSPGPTTTAGSAKHARAAKPLACARFDDFSRKLASTLQTSSGDPQEAIALGARVIDSLKQDAPKELRGDLQTLEDAFNEYAKELGSIHLDLSKQLTPKQLRVLNKASAQFSSAEVKAAQRHLDAWARENCTSRD